MISLYSSKRELIAALNELPEKDQESVRFEVKETLNRLLRQAKAGLLQRTDVMAMLSANDRSFHANKELGDTVTMIEDALIYHGGEEILQLIVAMTEADQRAFQVRRIINSI